MDSDSDSSPVDLDSDPKDSDLDLVDSTTSLTIRRKQVCVSENILQMLVFGTRS